MKLGIGIDTGGTYTDAVIYDFESQAILGTAKSRTTHNDLTIGILGAIDNLPLPLVQQAEVISLSTTLATNACVENKGGRAKLIFFGGDRKVLEQYGAQYGLPPVDEICLQDSFTHFSGESDREPDWEQFARDTETGFDDLDGVGIVEMNATRNGAANEKKAKKLFQKKHDLPVVCGHELFSELNCLQRGASTLLNAGLFPVIREFLASVKQALCARDIHPSAIVIVRSDGSLMSEEFASLRPVETLLCGPAASAIGCMHLTSEQNLIVVDMGGTTTDLAIIRNGAPITATGGVSIGKWRTFVNGLYVKTFGLGGDSAIHYQGEMLRLEEYRITPLCVAAQAEPSILENLRRLGARTHTRFLYEHYRLVRDIHGNPRYTPEEQAFCQALAEKPLLIADAAAAVGKDVYTLQIGRLLKDGVVEVCGLTPTDIMHIRGDFTEYNREAAVLAAEFVALNLGISVDELCERVYDEVKRKLYRNIVEALLENKDSRYYKNGVSAEEKRLIDVAYEDAKADGNGLLTSAFLTNFALIGVGAPIGIFLEDVARMLGTHAVIPQNYEIANALGAIMGNTVVSCSVEINPGGNADGISGFRVFGTESSSFFKELEDAIAYARTQAEEHARSEAKKRGAQGEITVTTQVHANEAQSRTGTVYLGTVVTACATAAMGF